MISVIIPTRNRADLLAKALESLTRQSMLMSEFEVLIIDNGSTDHTTQIIHEYKSMLPNLRGIYAPEPGLHTGRHAGMKAAKGEILVFADDDIEALPAWLTAINTAFSDPEVAMVGGNNLPMFLEPPPPWLSQMWQRPNYRNLRAIPALSIIEFSKKQRTISPYLIWGCNFSIRKNILLSAGGFHPDGMPKELIRFRGDGETHVSRYVAESGMKCIFHPSASVHHKVTPERMTFAYFHQRGFNQGVSDSYTALRNPALPSTETMRNLARRSVSWCLRKLAEIRNGREVNIALSLFNQGHLEGYAYHQKAYIEDAEVRDWVHKSIYYQGSPE